MSSEIVNEHVEVLEEETIPNLEESPKEDEAAINIEEKESEIFSQINQGPLITAYDQNGGNVDQVYDPQGVTNNSQPLPSSLPIGHQFPPFPYPPFFQYPIPNLGYQLPNIAYQSPYQQMRQLKREDEQKPPHHEFTGDPVESNAGKLKAPKRMKLNRRFMFNSLQKTILENEFANTNYPTNKRKEELAVDLGVKSNIIYNWFQNRRARKPYKYVLCVECKRKFSHPIEYEQQEVSEQMHAEGQAAAEAHVAYQEPPAVEAHITYQDPAALESHAAYSQGSQSSQAGIPEERAQLEYGNQSMEYPLIPQHLTQQPTINAPPHHVVDDPGHIPFGPVSMPHTSIITQANMPSYQHMLPMQLPSPQLMQVGGAPHQLPPMQQDYPILRLTSSPSPQQHKVSSRLVTPKMSPMSGNMPESSPGMLLPSPICSSPIESPAAPKHSVTSFLEQKPLREEAEPKLHQSF